jgi:CelD/BcsL family acetyltransferase involved in cellulose biosynthesis
MDACARFTDETAPAVAVAVRAGYVLRRIETLAEFDAERPRWEELERLDPNTTVFTTWRWLRAYFPVSKLRWSVLVASEDGVPVAYLPLARNRSALDRELYLGGNPAADYTGMVAHPGHARAAIEAFADAIDAMPWDGFGVSDVSDPNVDELVLALIARGAVLASRDETRCLWCDLPETWDRYVTEQITAKTRVNMLRVERRLQEALPNFRISEPTDADVDAHIDAMIEVNHARQGGNLANAKRRYGGLFRNAYDQRLLRLPIYWDGTKPVAGGAAFVDDERGWLGLYMIGFADEYEKLSPGKGIIGRAIRIAIESGYKKFDFMRGAEDYKARYAREVFVTRHYRLTRPGWRAAAIERARPAMLNLKLAVANVVYGPGREP